MNLTQEQKDAVKTIEGNVLVMAGAGSGKTQCYTTRIAYMIKQGIDPSSILGFTFTKKASLEMKKRLAKMIGKDKANKVPMGTFHSICYRILLAIDPEFSRIKIAPQWWVFNTLNDICKPANHKNRNGHDLPFKMGELATFISYQKANMVGVEDELLIDSNVEFAEGCDKITLKSAYATYERLKESSRQLDFDDMLCIFYKKMTSDKKADKEFQHKIKSQYKYIMVDEFQDSSTIMIEIIKQINCNNVYVVGDFRQSIYGFNNAQIENILNFKDDFENVKVIELNKNFRSTQNIVHLSNHIISNSPIDKYKEFKECESVAEVGDKIHFNMYQTEINEATAIANKIVELHSQGIPYNEIAVLTRTNAQSALYEDLLADLDIPYEVSKATSFYDRKEIVDILSYAQLAIDDDNASFRRVYNVPNRYLSKDSLEKLDEFASDHDVSLMEASRLSPQNADWKFNKNVNNLLDTIRAIRTSKDDNAGKLLRRIINVTKYEKHVTETTPSAVSLGDKLDGLEKLCSIASKFPNIKAMLAHIASVKDKQNKSKGKDTIKLSTIHSSKGLEWECVFVPSNVDGMMPHTMNPNIEEERRLFYVACSRPKKQLFVSWYLYNEDMEIIQESPFLTGILGEESILKSKKNLMNGNSSSTVEYPNN